MKKLITLFFASVLTLGIASVTHAQAMHGVTIADDHTAREEAAGKAIWEKFQAKEITCDKLTNDDFDALGEYFMGQMMGSSHVAMNVMMTQMLGEDGEAQMHVVMGKRLSGCDTSAALPIGSGGWMPMMNMMTGRWSSPFGFLGWIFMILWWVLIIIAVVALVKWLANQFHDGTSGKSAFDILKERYARGEVDKREFEEKKKELQ